MFEAAKIHFSRYGFADITRNLKNCVLCIEGVEKQSVASIPRGGR